MFEEKWYNFELVQRKRINKKGIKRESGQENRWVQEIRDIEGSVLDLIMFHCIYFENPTAAKPYFLIKSFYYFLKMKICIIVRSLN